MQISVKVKTRMKPRRVRKAVAKGNFESLNRAGAAVRLTARRSIRRSKKPSAPGKPPHTKKGAMRRAIMYSVEQARSSVIIGPAAAMVGDSGKPHEHGGKYKGVRYAKRPFMGPAVTKLKSRLPRFWSASVG